MDATIRAAEADDAEFLTEMLVEAANWSMFHQRSRAEVLDDDNISHYVDGWPRTGDFGVVAELAGQGTDGDQQPAGAAWCRLFDVDDPGYGYVSSLVPELTIAVREEHRGLGIGSRLIDELLARARDLGYDGVSLSVEDANQARELYRLKGFEIVGRNGNSDTMLCPLV
ncbi:N-acetyltransferase [Saxibacter everestensis]|uniref:N-acetyltransferase n=1 Tax=Saxibacter everestensis TaxID=2909229 RepID=A0ABY8QW96_9MICO|nr:N-acetyltransferase [Brevibacteriaceae bacterium ZFBP1038]